MRGRLLLQGALGAGLMAVGIGVGVAWERARADVEGRAELQRAMDATKAEQQKAREAQAAWAERSRRDEAFTAAAVQKRKAALGPVHECNLCGYKGPFKAISQRPEAGCPRCLSRERHRLLMHYLEHASPLFSAPLEVLQFSPMKGEADRLRKLKNLKYVTAEYEAGKADLQLDLTKLALPDASWDVLIAYHILEHIIDDGAAMREMFRVLRPGGMVILQVPLDPARTEIFEDPTVTTSAERARLFGQWDHVRWYSAAGLKQRLELAGFVVEPVDYLAQLKPEEIETFSLHSRAKEQQDEDIWIARKPAAPAEGAKKSAADKPGAKKQAKKAGDGA
jgi:SAM-dependent methyltransferase